MEATLKGLNREDEERLELGKDVEDILSKPHIISVTMTSTLSPAAPFTA